MSDDRFEDLLSEAAQRSCDGMLDSLPGREGLEGMKELTFSPEFEAKLKKRLARTRRRQWVRKALASAAAVFLVFLAGVGICLGVSTEARAAFTTWVRETFGNSYEYRFFNKPSDAALEEYTLGWMPEGYELIDHGGVPQLSAYELYSNGVDEIFFDYFRGSTDSMLGITSFGELIQSTVYVNGHRADLYRDAKAGDLTLIWIDEGSGICFDISGFQSEEALIKIAESVQKK